VSRPRPYRHLSNVELRRMSAAADAHLAQVIGRLNQVDPEFRQVLALTLELDAEKERRA
jgi:hypothetical protein